MSPITYYASQSYITDPFSYAKLFGNLPSDIPSLCKIVQNVIVHPYEAHLYGARIPKKRLGELDTRKVSLMLARIQGLDAQPLAVERPLVKRFVGNCRDFATLLCAMLRHQGIPARVRFGFATYFEPGFYTDHVICEYWHEAAQSWMVVDAQIDEVQRKKYHVAFDTCNVPRDHFILAGKAWQMYRKGEADPERFGIFSSGPRGVPFIQSGLIRDLAALNKHELLCQDVCGLADVEDERQLNEDDRTLLDQVAHLTISGNDAFPQLHMIFGNDSRLRVPPAIKCYTQSGIKMVDLTDEENSQ
jgi:hypothetical protein